MANIKKKAFTMSEILMVIAIIGITAILVVPNLSKNVDEDKLVTKTIASYNELSSAIEMALANYVDLYDYWYKWVNFYQLNSIWLKVFKRKLLDQQFEIEIKKYIQIEFSEDLIYSIPAIRNASSIYYLDQSLYYYRINPKSITANYKKGEHLIASAALPAFLNALNFLGFNDQKIQKQLYDYYLYFVWVRVYLAASTNQLTDSERNIVLNEIQSYEAVQQAYTHLNSANINMLCKIGLNIFYKSPEGKYAALCAFSKLYNKLRNLKVKLFTVS